MISTPGPWRITFDTNPDDCNLRCIMCEGFSSFSSVKKDRVAARIPKRRMDISLIRKILEEAVGSPLKEIIPSTMGEPLIYQHFEEIIQLCHQYDVKLNLTTNGTFPRKTPEAWSHLLVPITSDVKFSWNGSSKETQEKIMVGSNWEKVLSNVKTFIRIRDEYAVSGKNRCTVTLQMTFLETNVHELADIVKLGIDLGVDRIKGHHLWAHWGEIKDLSMRRNPEAIDRWNKAVLEAQEIAQSHRLPNGNHIRLENITVLDHQAEFDLDPDGVCPFLAKEAWVNTEGRFSPCCAPDQQRRTLGDFGNLTTTSLDQIWESSGYKTLQENYKTHPLCTGCNMRKPLTKIAG